MSLRHAILGFLSFKSLSGYDLKKVFDQSVKHFWPADQSQIYRTLRQLHEEDLINRQVFPRQDRPDMKLYEITDSGRQELQQWLAAPLPPSDTRDPFLVQLYFAFLLQDGQAVHLLQTEIDKIDGLLALYETVYDAAGEREQTDQEKRPLFYSMLTLEYGLKANHWYQGWLQSVKDRIEAGDTAVLPLEEVLGSGSKQETES